MQPGAGKIREIVRLGISETTESRAIDRTQIKKRVYSLGATNFGRWLLLILAVALLLAGATGISGFKTILQKIM